MLTYIRPHLDVSALADDVVGELQQGPHLDVSAPAVDVVGELQQGPHQDVSAQPASPAISGQEIVPAVFTRYVSVVIVTYWFAYEYI